MVQNFRWTRQGISAGRRLSQVLFEYVAVTVLLCLLFSSNALRSSIVYAFVRTFAVTRNSPRTSSRMHGMYALVPFGNLHRTRR